VRVGFPGGPRLEWYDRNPVKQDIVAASTTVGPHTLTSRASYTTPTGKKAFIECVFCQVVRITAASALGNARFYTRFRGSNNVVLLLFNNTVSAEVHEGFSQCATLNPGDTAELLTADDSTGGTVTYFGVLTATEFDA